VAAGAVGIALRRVELPAGGWSTPVHEHGSAEEIFYVLSGRGLAWQDGRTTEISAGDCIAHLPRRGAHTMYALDPLDVVVFGPRVRTETPRFPRLGLSLLGSGAVDTVAAVVAGVAGTEGSRQRGRLGRMPLAPALVRRVPDRAK